MARGTASIRYTQTAPRVRRGYFESRYGQLHVHNAIPPGGGFEEGTALMCLHRGSLSGRMFQRFLPLAGRDRSVYAPDTPGFGDSDPPPTQPTISDYAAAIGDFLDAMRFRQIDVLGCHTGALIAAELAIARPKQVRRVVLVSVPILGEAEREALKRPLPPPAEDGSHLVAEWRCMLELHGSRAPMDVVSRALADKLRNGPGISWGMNATAAYEARTRLGQITQPLLVLRPKDEMWDATQRIREIAPRARVLDLPEQGYGLFEMAPEVALNAVKDFLRG